MHECLLCKKDMKKAKTTFGNKCINNIYYFLNLELSIKQKDKEQYLFTKIVELTNSQPESQLQKKWLVDRYLTYCYLDKINYGNYDNIKKQLKTDIEKINQITNNKRPTSANKISLKQAYDLYKKVNKFKEGIYKISKGNYLNEDSIKTIITSISFIFHLSKNKSRYKNSAFKEMQFAFWQTIIEFGGKYADYPISAYFLQHSLEKNPKNLYIKDGNIIEEIKKDNNFQNIIKKIVEIKGNNNNKFIFKSKTEKKEDYYWAFKEKDLYYAMHLVDLEINGLKINDKWNLDIKIHDTYDYSKEKNIIQYYNDTNTIPKSMLSSTLYNLAAYSNYSGVMNIYDIDIEFSINDYK